MDAAAQDPDLPVDVAAWLVSDGVPIVDEATAALDEGADELAVGTRLRVGLPAARAAAAVAAAEARRRARGVGIDAAELLLLTREALEQASRPEVSRHRAHRFAGAPRVVDLCAGAGLDAMALGRAAGHVVAVDVDPSRALLLGHNTTASGVDVSVVIGDATAPPVRTVGLVHADPSRRTGGGRARRLDAYRPSLPALLAATGSSRGRGVVVSPAVDWGDPALPEDGEVEFVQVGPDLVEAMIWLGDLRRPGIRASATLLPEGGTRSVGDMPEPLPVSAVGEWLVEIAAAAVRARLHDVLGAEIDAHRVARNRALLTTASDPGPSPWWRRWRVEAVLPPRPREVRRWLRTVAAQPIEIAVHGLDADPIAWWRRLGSPERGPSGRRLHLVRTDDGAICVATMTVRDPVARTPAGPGLGLG